MIRVYLVDDHRLFLAGVQAELEGLVDIVGAASDVDEAIGDIRETAPDVVLVDVHMPGGGGLTVVENVASTHPDVKFLALSVSDTGRGMNEEQIELLRRLHDSKRFQMFAVTSRYSFLKKRTKQWFDHYKMNGIFEKIYINEKDEQPHLYKEEAIKKLQLDLFIEDDPLILDYLKRQIKDVDFVFVEDLNKYMQNNLF